MEELKSVLHQLQDLTKIHAYYFCLIIGSVFITSGIGLVTNSSKIGSEQVGTGFLAFGVIAIVLLSVFQGKLLSSERNISEIRLLTKSIFLKRTFVDALLFQYYFFSYLALLVSYSVWFYYKNKEAIDIQSIGIVLFGFPICFVIAHNNVGRIIRWVFALIPLLYIIIFLCLIKFR